MHILTHFFKMRLTRQDQNSMPAPFSTSAPYTDATSEY